MAVHQFRCIDAHTCGNPVRVVAEGGPILEGATMSEKRTHFLREFDWIRRGLMFEPRGHDMMSGSIFYPPSDPENDLGILFIETSGCLPMCGHGTIGSITIGIEEGLIRPKQEGIVRMETPAGLVLVEYGTNNGRVEWVKFTNVPSYLASEGLYVESSELGEIFFDVGYGGNFYAIVDTQQNYGDMAEFSAGDLISMGREIRQKINQKYPDRFIHPENPTIRDVSHVLWTGAPDQGATARSAVFYGDKAIDRSPCGTGTSARMAQWAARGKLKEGDEFIHESIIGSRFTGKVEANTKIDGKAAIIPSIKGWARIYGQNTITIDEADPYAHGFQVL
ncbi:MAG: 4-hydroxyproline epimerase [Flavobacteriaceae bacterium]